MMLLFTSLKQMNKPSISLKPPQPPTKIKLPFKPGNSIPRKPLFNSKQSECRGVQLPLSSKQAVSRGEQAGGHGGQRPPGLVKRKKLRTRYKRKATVTRLPWTEKHRPSTFDQIIGHESSIEQIKSLIKTRGIPNLLFYGPPGTGKSSTVNAMRNFIYGNDKINVREINASHANGIDVVRGEISNFAKPYAGVTRMLILEEADAMSPEAQEALRRKMEQTAKHCRYVLLCNNKSRLNNALISRCTNLRFGHLPISAKKQRLNQIIVAENVNITEKAVSTLIELEPDFRQIINSLQSLHYQRAEQTSYKTITTEDIYQHLSLPNATTVKDLITTIGSSSMADACATTNKIISDNLWDIRKVIEMITTQIVNDDTISDKVKLVQIPELAKIHYQLLNGFHPKMLLTQLACVIMQTVPRPDLRK